MGVDAQLKRYFPLVLCGLIAMAAYFQASGIGQLVAATVGDVPATEAAAAMPALGSFASDDRETSGKPILARHPFDSVTGPLDGRAAPMPMPQAEQKVASGEPSKDDPSCEFGRVLLISASDDPEWSFAAIEAGGGGSKMRRNGDDVSGYTVQAMAWDRVWFTQAGKRCQMKLGDVSKGPAKPAAGAATPGEERPARGRGRQLSPEMASKISKVSDTEFNVERSLVDEILENQAELMRSARIVPEIEGDEVVGIRMFGIRSGSLLSHLGMQNGDRLESINGFQMTDPQKALEAYGRLRSADSLKVQINRKGSPMTLEFNIQ